MNQIEATFGVVQSEPPIEDLFLIMDIMSRLYAECKQCHFLELAFLET